MICLILSQFQSITWIHIFLCITTIKSPCFIKKTVEKWFMNSIFNHLRYVLCIIEFQLNKVISLHYIVHFKAMCLNLIDRIKRLNLNIKKAKLFRISFALKCYPFNFNISSSLIKINNLL